MTMLTHDGITQPASEWALDYGIPAELIRSRIKSGWTVDKAITQPMRAKRGAKLPASKPKRESTPKPKREPKPKQQREPRIYKRTMLTFNGETLSIIEWAARIGVNRNTIRARLERGWSLERTLTTLKHTARALPPNVLFIEYGGERHHLSEWSRRTGIGISTLWARLKVGWTVEDALTYPVERRRTGRPKTVQ